MNSVDKLTLELFTNKIQYKKYLSKIEPENYNEIQEFREKCLEYKNEILKQMDYLLTTTNNVVISKDPFYIFTSELIKDIERKKEVDLYEENEGEIYEEEDEDEDEVLFPPDKMMNREKEEEDNEEEKEYRPTEKYSFWGKERVIQQNSNSDFISHYPTNTSVRRRFVGRRNSILPKDT